MIFYLLSVIIFVGYALLIAALTIGWWRLKTYEFTGPYQKVKISIVVAVRNEAANIETLLGSLLRQDYPPHLLEIIISDDQSADQTMQIAAGIFSGQKREQSLKLVAAGPDDSCGKKAAINRGIVVSTGELIVITDADCQAGPEWISAIASYFAQYRPQMILGPVKMTDSGSFFGKLQSLEFISLISSAAGSCNAGFPLLANGANLAFTRFGYDACEGFAGNIQYPSGDDMFLMISIKKKFGTNAIRFLRSEKAIVNTPATRGLKPFLHQRIRWVSKSSGYTDPLLIAASLIVFMVNTWLLITVFWAFIFPEFLSLFLLYYLGKMIIDLPLMISYSRFQKSAALIWLFPFMELLNAGYTLVIGIVGNMGRYEWKERKVSTNSHKLSTNLHKY